MAINYNNAGSVLKALQDAQIPDNVLYYAFAQSAFETAEPDAFTSNIFTTYNNGAGLVFGNSAAQKATGAYDSGDAQPDGDYNYAAYPNLDSFALDFKRILSLDLNGVGAPIYATNITDYVNRLKANNFFGSDPATYAASLTNYYNQLISLYPPGGSAAAAATGSPAPAAGSLLNAKNSILAIAATVIIGLLLLIVIEASKSMKAVILSLCLFLAGAAASGQVTPPAPLPPPSYANYGVTQWGYWSPQWSILDSLALGPGIHVNQSGTGSSSADSAFFWDFAEIQSVFKAPALGGQGVFVDPNISNSVFIDPTTFSGVFVDPFLGTGVFTQNGGHSYFAELDTIHVILDSVNAGLWDPVAGSAYLSQANTHLNNIEKELDIANGTSLTITSVSLSATGSYNVTTHQTVIGGYNRTTGAKIGFTDLSGETAYELGLINGSIPASVPIYTTMLQWTSHTVVAGANPIVIFVISY